MSGRKVLTTGAVVPRFQSALKKLATQGIAALKPTKIVRPDETVIWRGPAISNRVSNVLRKTAIRDGTYGSFDTETLRGWDAQWDIDLAITQGHGNGRIRLRVPKKQSRHRTREERAQKIEQNLEGMDERIEKFYEERLASKPPQTFERKYKKMMLLRKK
jgi:hypothetical protein